MLLIDTSVLVMVLRDATGANAARMFFDLRRNGKTIRKLFDCCIAQVAIENKLTLVHNDRDFSAIADSTQLKLIRVDLTKA